MKRRVAPASIARRLPKGTGLPAPFAAFARAAAAADTTSGGYFHVGWRDPTTLTPSAIARALVPFVVLGDGGVVAFWIHGEGRLPIVHHDSEGGRRIVAVDLADFVGRLARRATGIAELDDALTPIVVPGARPRAAPLAATQRAFEQAARAADPQPAAGHDLDALRRALVALGAAMVAAGACNVHDSPRAWKQRFKAVRVGNTGWAFSYLRFGEQRRVPKKYGLEPRWLELLPHCKHPQHTSFDLLVSSSGLVSVDRDQQLLLVPPA